MIGQGRSSAPSPFRPNYLHQNSSISQGSGDKKRALSHHWDKTSVLRYHPSWRRAPTPSTYIYTRRADNGCGPRQKLLKMPSIWFALPSQVHSPKDAPLRSHHPQLSERPSETATPLAHRCFLSVIVLDYTLPLSESQAVKKENFGGGPCVDNPGGECYIEEKRNDPRAGG